MNWYSKRAMLGAVYVSTELYMITDRSANYVDTWSFLNRRLEDVAVVGKLPSEVQAGMKSLGSMLLQLYRAQTSGTTPSPTAGAEHTNSDADVTSNGNGSNGVGHGARPSSSSTAAATPVTPV